MQNHGSFEGHHLTLLTHPWPFPGEELWDPGTTMLPFLGGRAPQDHLEGVGAARNSWTVTTAKGPSLSDSAEGCSLVGLTLPTEEEQRVSCSRSSSAEVIVCSR